MSRPDRAPTSSAAFVVRENVYDVSVLTREGLNSYKMVAFLVSEDVAVEEHEGT